MKKYIITGIIGLLLVGVGCGFLPFEIINFDYVDGTNPSIEKKIITKEYAIIPSQTFKIHASVKVKVIPDERLNDTIELRVSYPEKYFEMQSIEIPNENIYQLFYEFESNFNEKQIKEVFNIFLKDISNKKFYNYNKTFSPEIEIRVSSANLENIKIIENYYDDNKEGFDF